MGMIGDFVDGLTGGKAASKAAIKGSNTAATGVEEGSMIERDAMGNATDYLVGQNAIDSRAQKGATQQMMGLYGLGGEGNQQQFIDAAENSPLYSAITGTREAGEQSILRNAAATGGLRSGNVQNNMYDFNQRLDERALLESYDDRMGGLDKLMGINTNENQIAQGIAAKGQIRGQGITDAASLRGMGTTAAGQAIQSGRGGLMDTAASVFAAW
jgi:hypothetical protein